MRPERVAPDAVGIARASEHVRAGHIVAFPSESSYGLAVLALDAGAVQRLHRLKGRLAGQYLSLLVDGEVMLSAVVRAVPKAARALIDAHWPGALTLVLPAAAGLPRELVNPDGGIGVRVSSDPVACALVEAVGAPITATSANFAGGSPATDANAAALDGVALVIDAGPRTGAASTVVAVSVEGVVRVLRAGPVQVES